MRAEVKISLAVFYTLVFQFRFVNDLPPFDIDWGRNNENTQSTLIRAFVAEGNELKSNYFCKVDNRLDFGTFFAS